MNHSSNNFLSPPIYRTNQNTAFLSNNTIAQEVFRKSINMSYIGRMSGQKQLIHKLQPQETQRQKRQQSHTPAKRKRIDFSRFRGQATQDIKQTVLTQEDKRYLFIKSFTDTEGKEEVHENSCLPCHSNSKGIKCLLEMSNESTLEIYISENDKYDKLFASINFDTISVQILYDNIVENKQIMLIFAKYRLLLEHQKQKIVQFWHSNIQTMLKQSKGQQFTLKQLSQTDQFYLNRYQTEQFFRKNCETGDMILFQDNHFFAKAQRFITGSDFDHVGMVIKDSNHGILIFQSNSGSGVCLTPWRYVIRYGWYRYIPRITWRRLKTERNNQFSDIVEKFVLQNLAKKYHISFAKITAHQSVIRPVGNIDQHAGEQNDDQSGYFCSELIATLYKQLGLLTRDKQSDNYQPACKFYPKDFSERSGRKLDKGELSPQYAIYFDDILLKSHYPIEKK